MGKIALMVGRVIGTPFVQNKVDVDWLVIGDVAEDPVNDLHNPIASQFTWCQFLTGGHSVALATTL